MTRPRTDTDRLRIVGRARTALAALGTAPDTVSHLRARIALEVDDGLAGTAYDGDGRSGHGMSHAERVAASGRRDRARADQAALDDALATIDDATRSLAALAERYPPPPARPPSQLRPGIDPCPAGTCEDHWAAGERLAAAQGRHRSHCRACAAFRQRHGRGRTAAEIRARVDSIGRTIAERPPHPADGHGPISASGA